MTPEGALKYLNPFTADIPIEALNTIRETWPAAEPALLAAEGSLKIHREMAGHSCGYRKDVARSSGPCG